MNRLLWILAACFYVVLALGQFHQHQWTSGCMALALAALFALFCWRDSDGWRDRIAAELARLPPGYELTITAVEGRVAVEIGDEEDGFFGAITVPDRMRESVAECVRWARVREAAAATPAEASHV